MLLPVLSAVHATLGIKRAMPYEDVVESLMKSRAESDRGIHYRY
jgi:hypothetical protein